MRGIDLGVTIIFCSLLGGFATGYIAYVKARKNVGDWAIYGALLPFIALPHITGAESLPTDSRGQIAIRKLVVRLQWFFYLLSCLVFYKLVTVMDQVTNTEELFRNIDGKLIFATSFILVALITALTAFNKGRNNIRGWFAYGALLPLLAFPHILLVRSRSEVAELRRKNRR